jgi:aspartyl-tRNA(Asn)/glutamyl-tRNA(Gln) amidotransferase subunit B
VRDGIAQEVRRQVAVVQAGGTITQETRDYDGQTGESKSLRSKEMAHDYRYFPDPDLMPVQVGEEWKQGIRATCPELPFDRQRRLMKEYEVPYTITSVLIPDRDLCDFFEEAARLCGKPQAAGNWIANDLLRELGSARIGLAQSKARPAHVAGLVKLVDEGVILSNAAKEVFIDMFRTGELPEAVVARKGLRAETDLGELEKWCAEAIASNPKSVADFKSGKESAINAFKGPVMRAAKGKADPKRVDEMLRRLLAG